MGQCVEKQETQEVETSKKQPVTLPSSSYEQVVAISEASRRSSNAAITVAKYNLQRHRQLHHDYEVDGKVLGQGLCGDVVLARGRADSRPYAMKVIRKSQLSHAKLKQMTNEVEIYLSLDHPNIARLHNVYESANDISLLTECCLGGELYLRLQKNKVYTNDDAAEATRQMLRAVGYLHAHHVVHRDLKLENFLYESDDPGAQLKLIDFGFAKLWDPSTLMMASCGSVTYVSPDVLARTGYTNKCDLWSLGVIVWMLLVGYPPFHGEEARMLEHIKAGQPDWSHKSRWAKVSSEAIDFVKQLLKLDPVQRMDAKLALKHPWLSEDVRMQRPQGSLSSGILQSLQRYACASKARRAVLQLLAQELAPEETKELRELFLSIDKSNEGTISMRDLKEAIRNSGSKISRRRAALKANALSLNMDGDEMSPASSFTAADDASPVSEGSASPGGSGSPVTPAIRRLRRASTAVFEEMFHLLDANGNDKIYYSDFLAATLEARSSLRKEVARATFSRLDADMSGKISAEDLRAVIGETFEGVRVEDLVADLNLHGRQEIGFEEFIRLLEDHDITPGGASPRVTAGFSGWHWRDASEAATRIGGA